MMRRVTTVLAAFSLLATAFTMSAQAQPAPTAKPAPAAQQRAAVAAEVGEIIVTARRTSENLQDVPVSVTAITAQELQDLNILSFNQIQDLVPGLELTAGDTAGIGSTLSMRGVTFNINTSGSSTVETYLNDVPIELNYINQALYDVGQIEVLKGPQGTLRGRPSPSGSITYTWREPNLNRYGGSASVTLSNLDGRNVQGALNIPIINDKLAIRVAGILNQDDAGGVRSTSTRATPFQKSESWRISVRYEPTETLKAVIGYQNIYRHTSSLGGAIWGPGFAGGGPASLPANWNGPAIGMFDRLNVAPFPTDGKTRFEIVTAHVDYDVFDHTLTYVGGWKRDSTIQLFNVNSDNFLRAMSWYNGGNYNKNVNWTHEVRLAGEKKLGGKFDYTLGAFVSDTKRDILNPTVAVAVGAYGAPNQQRPVQPNPRFLSQTTLMRPIHDSETSGFLNLKYFLFQNTEVTGGVRYHVSKVNRHLESFNEGGWASGTQTQAQCVNSTSATGVTTIRVFGATYPGVCDSYTPPRTTLGPIDEIDTEKTWLYSFSLAQRINDDILAYAMTANSFRSGPLQVIATLNANIRTNYLNDPIFARAVSLNPEKSKTYEIGFKTTWFDKRLRFNIAGYHQVYSGFFYQARSVASLNWQGPPAVPAVNNTALVLNADIKVNGIELETGGNITRNWSATARWAWQKGEVRDELPCSDGNFDGVPDTITPSPQQFIDRGIHIALCEQTDVSNRSTRWNASVQSEYHHEITSDIDAFVRGQVTIRPKNPYVSQTFVVPATNLVNLFAGIRSADRAWEITASVANLFNTVKVTSDPNGNVGQNTLFAPTAVGGTGYRSVNLTPRREFSLSVRYAFGSR